MHNNTTNFFCSLTKNTLLSVLGVFEDGYIELISREDLTKYSVRNNAAEVKTEIGTVAVGPSEAVSPPVVLTRSQASMRSRNWEVGEELRHVKVKREHPPPDTQARPGEISSRSSDEDKSWWVVSRQKLVKTTVPEQNDVERIVKLFQEPMQVAQFRPNNHFFESLLGEGAVELWRQNWKRDMPNKSFCFPVVLVLSKRLNSNN